ncbi:CDK5 regulatory subunit-associated protein 2 isoform X6 [Mesocricetus auratus]|uniref:CDK5 regulatory subunit-associated protein 2 n=1 Tax=Mesocricetus auratus TaxID=10036 RepID=A0ABM2YEQ1_MESAU|nr:CDK5 regulatory subunit-associated protein 2 isoform X6 [Mesocricetus auratus]
MDSGMEEDITLPATLSGCSGLHPVLPSDLDGINDTAGLGNGVLPNMPEEKVSPTRARNMKDFENQITELKKENFNLKLRIYFLEERMQQEFAGPTEHIYKTNIELKVEVESLKRELQERDQLLVKASKAVESLAEGGGSQAQRMKEDARREAQHVEDVLMQRIHLLEEDVKAAQAELEKAYAGTETEKALRLRLESRLSAMKKTQEGGLEKMTLALEEKDRLIEELKLSLKSKEALIQCLKEEKSQMASPDENVSSGELRGLSATLREEKERDAEAAQREWQKERSHFEEKIQALQEDLREKEREIATEKKNSLKRDKAIQGLTMALKSKEKEVEELNSEIKELTAAFAEAREAPLKTQATKFQEEQQSDYEGLTGDLKTEQSIYAHLAKTLRDSDSANDLQAELKEVLALRKQLEQDVLAYRNLQKALQEQLSEIQRREEEPFSFYSDQTSYLSICLEDHNQFQVEHFSQEELKKKVSDLIQLVKDLYTDNQHLKKTIFDLSSMGFQGNSRLESTKQTELLASKEDEDTIKIEADDENHFQSDHHLKQSNEMMEDYAKGVCKNGYLKHMDSNILDHDGTHTPGIHGDQSLEDELQGLLATVLQKKATLSLESRPDLLKALGALLLDRICLAEQGLPGDHLDSKARKALQQVAIQLRDELGHSFPDNSFSKSHNELKSTWRLVKTGDEAEVELKNASVQTIVMEDMPHEFKSEGKREACEGKLEGAIFSTDPESEALSEMPELGATLQSLPSAVNKDAEKTGLLIQLKTSELLANTYALPASQEVVAQLQGQVLELQRELKEYKTHNKQLHDKLLLAEAMIEGMAIPNPELLNGPAAQPLVRAADQDNTGEQEGPETTHSAWRDKEVDSDQYTGFEIDSEICPPDDLALLPACKESPEDFLGPTSVATYLNSKSQLSVKVSVIGTDQSDNINISSDSEDLKRKIHDLQTELDGYRNFIVQLQKHSQCSEAIITVLCGTEGAHNALDKPKRHIDEEERAFSRLHQVRYVKHLKILRPLTPQMIDSGVLENLKRQLVEQEQELQKEQDLNLKLFSEIHNLQNKFRDLSPSRYDSLVQSQARELSLQRQQIKDSHDICVIYRQHMSTMIKAFEELLQASDVDSCVAEGFREQLTQCAELLEQLEKLFLHGELAGVEPRPESELLERLRTEGDNLTYQHLLPESPEPSASHALSDDEVSDKSFLSGDQKPDSETEKCPEMPSHFPQDLLMEHIQEIRTLRNRLEESIKTNEKLRKQLERQGSEAEQGSTNVSAYGSELHSSLTSEIHFLRKQNQALSMMLEKGSRDKQKENEKLLESLSRKAASLEHLQLEYTSVKEENERLQRDISEKERHNQQLTQEVCSSRQELSRVQEEMKSRQQLLSQNDKLLQSLRVELKVYEKLNDEHRKLQREAQGEASGEGWKEPDSLSTLHGLLTEMQALRDQLERSIQTNNTLRSKLEEQLSLGPKMAQEGALTLAVTEWSLQLDKHDGSRCPEATDNSFDLFDSTQAMAPKSASETPLLSRTDVDSLSCDSSTSATSPPRMPCVVARHLVWASKAGHHMLGLSEDYDALHKQITQGQRLLAKMDIQTQEALSPPSQKLGSKDPHSVPLSKFLSSMNTAKQILEEASRLLKLFWRVSVPTDGQCSLHSEQIGEMKAEITKLHKKLFEQEKKLQNTAKLLQQKKHQEKVICDQLVITHQVLRKARRNLERRTRAAHPGTSSPSSPGS